MAGIGDYTKGKSFSEMFKKKSPFSFLNFNFGGTNIKQKRTGDKTISTNFEKTKIKKSNY